MKVSLKQVRPDYFKGGVRIVPPVDRRTGRIYKEEKAKEFGITQDSRFLLDRTVMLDLSDPKDALWIEYAKLQGVVVDKQEQAISKPNCAYYLFSEEVDSADKVTIIERKLRAMELVKDASSSKKKEVLKLLGIDPEYLSDSKITAMLYTIAETTVSKNKQHNLETLTKIFEEPDYDVKLLIADAKFKGIIRIDGGYYYHGDTLIGKTLSEVVAWVQSPTNFNTVSYWKTQLYGQTIDEVIVDTKGNTKSKVNKNV